MINIYTQDGQQSWQLLYNLNLFRKWKTYICSSTVTPRLKIFKQAEQWHHLLILTLIQTLYKTLTRTVYSEGKKLRREVMKKIFKHLRRLFILLSHHDVLNLNLCSLVNPSNAQIDAKTLCIDWILGPSLVLWLSHCHQPLESKADTFMLQGCKIRRPTKTIAEICRVVLLVLFWFWTNTVN